MRFILVAVLILAVFHALLGIMSICLGVTASIQADVWLAHSVSPIWSGGLFTITGILGFVCAKKRTAYMIMCFTAFSIVSLVTAVVSIQLLRLGLVNQTTDGETYQKEHKDKLIIVALGVTAVECLICVISAFVSCRLARTAKKDMERKRDGTFHVQENGEVEGNKNKCAVYSVEKGYHNPYLQSHDQGDEVDSTNMLFSNIEPVQEDHIHIMVNGKSDLNINTAEEGNHVLAPAVTTDDSNHGLAVAASEDSTTEFTPGEIGDTNGNHGIAPADVNTNQQNNNPFTSGVTYHWKNKFRPESRGGTPRPNKKSSAVDYQHDSHSKHSSNGSDDNAANIEAKCDKKTDQKQGMNERSDNQGHSVRVEIDEHTDDEDCRNLATTNIFFVKGTGDKSKTMSDLEVTSP